MYKINKEMKVGNERGTEGIIQKMICSYLSNSKMNPVKNKHPVEICNAI
jgi:hypothetical protein